MILRTIIITVIALLAGTANATADGVREQWRQMIDETSEILSRSDGDAELAVLNLHEALTLAEKSLGPKEVAISLERLATAPMTDAASSLKLLSRSMDLKKAQYGAQSAEVADTLLLIASAQESAFSAEIQALKNAGQEVSDSDMLALKIERRIAVDARQQALEIRREVFGESSCEVGQVELLLALEAQVAGDLDRAESMFREILAYCPPMMTASGEIDTDREDEVELVGYGAFASLSELLRGQERDGELEKLEQQFNW